MFNSGFDYIKVTHQGPLPTEKFVKNKIIYRFTSPDSGEIYLVHIYEYEHKVFVVKFHLRKEKNSKTKFNTITNLYECQKVLGTVINICLEIYSKEPLASFGFIGMPKLTEDQKMIKNQRFRVYKSISESLMGIDTFKHVEVEAANSYILINRSNSNFEELTKLIPKMFVQIFQDYGQLLSE